MRKIAVAITGASGSIYAENLIKKFVAIKEQWTDLAIVMTENAYRQLTQAVVKPQSDS